MKTEDRAYLAGVMDGEGCIMIAKGKSPNTPLGFQLKPLVEITMCERQTIQYIFDTFPCNPIHTRVLPSGKIAYKILWTNTKAHDIIEMIFPFLRGKKPQAAVFLEFQKYAPGRGTSYNADSLAKVLALRNKLQWLKTSEALRC